jgi:hypothetical protein
MFTRLLCAVLSFLGLERYPVQDGEDEIADGDEPFLGRDVRRALNPDLYDRAIDLNGFVTVDPRLCVNNLLMMSEIPMSDHKGLRVNSVEEETDFRCAVHEVIARVLADRPGRTLIDIAEGVDVSVRTISNAFNRTHSLSQTFLTRLGKVFGPHVLDPVAALSGGRMIALEVSAQRDVLPFLTRAANKVAEARSPDSPGGTREIHTEKANYLPDLRTLRKELDCLIWQIEADLAA